MPLIFGGVLSLIYNNQRMTAREGHVPKGNSVAFVLLGILRALRAHQFTGEPKRDWIVARKRLSDCGSNAWAEIAEYAEQLIAFQRGQFIASQLTELWQTQGTYAGARDALDSALAQEQLLSGGNDLHGIHTMTIHKAKAKEFDGVIILDEANSCPLVRKNEPAPFSRSRKLFRVGITRARHHVLLLTDRLNPCPLLQGHHL